MKTVYKLRFPGVEVWDETGRIKTGPIHVWTSAESPDTVLSKAGTALCRLVMGVDDEDEPKGQAQAANAEQTPAPKHPGVTVHVDALKQQSGGTAVPRDTLLATYMKLEERLAQVQMDNQKLAESLAEEQKHHAATLEIALDSNARAEELSDEVDTLRQQAKDYATQFIALHAELDASKKSTAHACLEVVRQHPEYRAMLENLTNTQTRCTELLEENRALKKGRFNIFSTLQMEFPDKDDDHVTWVVVHVGVDSTRVADKGELCYTLILRKK